MELRPSHEAYVPSADSLSTQIHAAQVDMLYRQGYFAITVNLSMALLMTAALWYTAPGTLLVPWFGTMVAVLATRFGLVSAFLRISPLGQSAVAWAKWAAMGTTVTGLLWGTAVVVMFPEVSLVHRAVLCFFVGAVALGTATVNFPLREVYVPALLAGGLPLAGVFMYQGDLSHFMMGALALAFVMTLLLAGNRMHAALTASLKLQFENQNLVRSLSAEKAAIEQLNVSLRTEINERGEMEQALRESEERFRDLIDLLPVFVYETDEKGSFTFVNRLALDLGGYTWDEISRSFGVERAVIPEDRPRVLRDVTRIMTGEKLIGEQYTVLKKAGDTVPIEVWSNPIVRGEKIVGGRGVGIDVTERKKAEERIKTSLKEKEILLREIHHRVKNNLAVISSLLRLKSRFAPEDMRSMFEDALDRVKAMAIAHEKLYQSENLATLDIGDYVESLVEHLFLSSGCSEASIALKKNIEPLSLGLDTALPLGLLLTELVSNCLKHAFPNDGRGEVEIVLRSAGSRQYELVVRDNGVGIPDHVDFRNPGSLGLELVDNFVKQLHGTLEIDGKKGAEIRVRFREKQRRFFLHEKTSNSCGRRRKNRGP